MFIDPQIASKILLIAGITNVIFVVLVFFSCRCLVGKNIYSRLIKYDWYKKFYTKHCYYWWAFFISVLVHTFLALSLYF